VGRWVMPVFVVVTLAVPAAQAKAPPDGVRLCGAGGACVSIGRQDAERMGVWGLSGAVDPGRPAPYYVLHYRWGADAPEQTSYWIPSSGLFRTVSPSLVSWYRVPRNSMETVTAGIAPIAVPTVISVTVAGKPAREPSTYLRLFSIGRRTHIWPGSTWLRIRFTATASSPWTDASAGVRIAKEGAYLLRDDTVFTIPKRLAHRARRGLSLA
jgi:hypothetical protein